MNAATQTEITALSLPERAAVALGAAAHEVKLRALLTNSAGILAITNKAGREECHAAYMVLKNARCSIANLSNDATEDAKKFTKAVKTEADRLTTITEAEEARLLILRDRWDSEIEAEKKAKIEAEIERIAAIRERIAMIRAKPWAAVGRSSEEIGVIIGDLVGKSIGAEFGEFQAEAIAAKAEALELLAKSEAAQRAIEVDAESRRQEAARMKARQEEEAAAAAAELAAEREELRLLQVAQAQQAAKFDEAQRLAKVEADRVATNQEAIRQGNIATAKRLAADQAAHADEVKRQADALAAQQAAADARDAEAERQAQVDAAHGEGLVDDEAWDIENLRVKLICIQHAEALELNAMFDAAHDGPAQMAQLAAHAQPTPLAVLADVAGNESPSDAEIIIGLAGSLEKVLSWIANWYPEFCNDPDWPADHDRARAAISLAEDRAA